MANEKKKHLLIYVEPKHKIAVNIPANEQNRKKIT